MDQNFKPRTFSPIPKLSIKITNDIRSEAESRAIILFIVHFIELGVNKRLTKQILGCNSHLQTCTLILRSNNDI